ncbi:MAG: hypothetical protein CW338_05420 [Clostridiales bacterium]|nr:hypothetical protein [Clostridiales bacterium]
MNQALKRAAAVILCVVCVILLCSCGAKGTCRICGMEKEGITSLNVTDEEWKVCPECLDLLLSAYEEAHACVCDNCRKKCDGVKDISVNGKTQHVCADCYREMSKSTCAICNGKYEKLTEIVIGGTAVSVCDSCRSVVEQSRDAYGAAAGICDFCGDAEFLYDVETDGETLHLCADCKKVKNGTCDHCGATGRVLEKKVNGTKMNLCATCSRLVWDRCGQCGKEGLLNPRENGGSDILLCDDCLRLYAELDGVSTVTAE